MLVFGFALGLFSAADGNRTEVALADDFMLVRRCRGIGDDLNLQVM